MRRQHVQTQYAMQDTTLPAYGHGRAPYRRVAMVASLAVFAFSACKDRGDDSSATSAWTPNRSDVVMGVPSAEVVNAIKATLQTRPPTMTASRWKYVERLYLAYDNVPLWLDANGFQEARSTALLRALLDAGTDAIRIDAYPLDELVSALGAVRQNKTPSAAQLASADLLLTSAYVSLSEDLLTGQLDPRSLEQDWHIAANREAIDSAVARSLRDARLDSAIARMRPQDADYTALRRALVRFRTVVDDGGWPAVPTGKAIKPGQTDAPARLAALRTRLRLEGFGTDTNAPSTGAGMYDATLAANVAAYQQHHGIVVDSVLGEETVQSLNRTAQYRLAQIAANLERYRWLPRSFGERYIVVNVPAFRLEAHDSTGVLAMKVIVGKEFEGRKTPVFADSMETVVFRPYWNITPNIQAGETAPKIAENPAYMKENDLEYFKDGGETRIRQKPGPKNSLGLVKFLFPNSFNIYLHDTPEQALFDQDVRGFSHGCIRLEKPAELAQWALGWDSTHVNTAMHEGEDNQSAKLSRKIPVFIVYATVYERDGRLYFGNDVYSRDDAMVAAVAGSVTPSETAVRQLSALRKLVGG